MEKTEQNIQNDSIITKMTSNDNKMEKNIFRDLVEIYEQCKLNSGIQKCIFNETEIFREGWLLIGVLNCLMKIKSEDIEDIEDIDRYGFLPFPTNRIIYSQGHLQSPFPPVFQSGKCGEGATKFDGIVGQFKFKNDTKTMITISDDFDYLSIFEAKMYSDLHKGLTYAENYSQVTQIVSSMINSIMNYDKIEDKKIFLIILYPDDHPNIPHPDIASSIYSEDFIKGQIKERIKNYKICFKDQHTGDKWDNLEKFEKNYERLLNVIKIRFIYWEDIFKLIKTDNYSSLYYDHCKEFNKK